MNLTVVTGPPCGGKSSYVRDHAGPADVVIDLDRIALALAVEGTPHHEYADHVRQLAIEARQHLLPRAVALAARGTCHVWIVQMRLTARDLTFLHGRAEIVTVDPGIDACLERASHERPGYAADLIHGWYRAQT